MLPILTIARNAFVESLRQPIFLLIVVLCGVLQVLNTWGTGFSMGYSNVPGEVTGDNKLLFDVGLATVFVCGILLAAFIATSVISREIENKTVLTVVSKPIGRPTVVVGKFLGIAAAMAVAVVIMLLFLLLGIRHGVMTTAADTVDMPVVVFGVGAVALSVLLAAVTNYLYGWSFGQTAVLAMLPSLLIGYVLVLSFSNKWELQPLTTDFKPQISLACFAIGMALLVISAVATAASTRLGQVMTIVVCAGVFLLGLLSNHLIGRHAFVNKPYGVVQTVRTGDGIDPVEFFSRSMTRIAAERAGMTVEQFEEAELDYKEYVTAWDAFGVADLSDPRIREMMLMAPGSRYQVILEAPPAADVKPGDPFYYAPAPNGLGMAVPAQPRLPEGVPVDSASFDADVPPALVVTDIDDVALTVRNIGVRPLDIDRPPLPGDFVFAEPTEVNYAAAGLWSLVPNMHAFWLVDAITQAKAIPPGHIALVAAYGLVQTAAFLSLAVILFQGRDVG